MLLDMSTARRDEEHVTTARVLVEMGDLDAAEREIEAALDHDPQHLAALNLFAKVKHIRGELSQAVACWAQIHAQSPHNERARMCLGAILQLMKDPERAAGEFVALGQHQIARKPAAHLELEKAFRLFLQQKPDEARAVCDRLAAKLRGSERDLYKLAVLASAWIAELSLDLPGACSALERLGEERGFETDVDRVLALARVYERLGTPMHLDKAVYVYLYLGRSFEKLSTLGRLATIFQKLGREREAKEFEQKYLVAFQKRMHRVSRAEVARIAASRYLPLEKLARVRCVDGDDIVEVPRERGIVAALWGERSEAYEHFRSGGEILDLKYTAELSLMDGDVEGAVSGWLEALRADPADLRVLSALLDLHERKGAPRVARMLAEPELSRRVAAALDGAVRASPLTPGVWSALGTFRAILGEEREASRCRGRAEALRAAADRDARPIGRVLAAAAFHFVGKSKGLVHQVWVDRTPALPSRGGTLAETAILGNVTFEMKQAIRNTFFAVREYARSRFPQQTADILDFDYTYKVTKEDEPSSGLSAGLPTALAFLSVFLQRPVPQDAAFTGVLIADAHDALVLRGVGDTVCKAKGAYNRNLRMLVLPAENRVELAGSAELPRAVETEIVRYARTLDDAVTLTFGNDVWLE
jgi:tetratricopeptide (TPR) repeat protein